MNWRRIKIGGYPQSKKEYRGDHTHCKEWRGGRGRYKIIWRDQVQGINVTPGFHTLYLESTEGGEFWELINRGRPLRRTLKAAKRACEAHANPPKPRKKRKKNV